MSKMKIIYLIISFLWIVLGTFIQLSGYPDYNYWGLDYNSFIYKFLWWVSFPFNILLFVLLYADTLNNIYIFVIFLQSINLLIFWWIIYKLYISFQKVKSKSSA